MRKQMKILRAAAACLLALAMLAGCSRGGERTASAEAVERPAAAAEHAAGLDALQSAWEARTSDSGTILRLYYDDTQSMLGFVKGNGGSNRFVYLLDAAIDEAFGMVNAPENGVAQVEAYTLVDENPGDGASQELSWQQVDMTGTLRNFFMVDSFYTGDHAGHREGTLNHTYEDGTQGQMGPLARLFADGATPFVSDGLTVLVTDLQEQGFDLNTLSSGLIAYCEQMPSAKVCIVAATSTYSGQLSAPVYSISGTGTSIASIDDYTGEAAFYYVIAGPANLVDSYCARIRQAMGDDAENILFTSFCTADASCGQPLTFTLAPNTMVGVTAADLADDGAAAPGRDDDDLDDDNDPDDDRDDDPDDDDGREQAASSEGSRRTARTAAADTGLHLTALRATNTRGEASTGLVSQNIDKVWGSANINDLAPAADQANLFTARMGRGDESCSAFGTYAQIAAYADLSGTLAAACGENGAAPADDTYWIDPGEIELYAYSDGGWATADANALGCIDVRFETVDGPLQEYATGKSLLAENRHVAYLRMTIDGTTTSQGGLFADGGSYYLSIPVHTSLNASLVRNAEQLAGMSAGIAEYRTALEGLTKSGKNYSWTASSDEARAAAAAQLCRTPKLDELVKSLSNYFQSADTVNEVQYVDVMFTVQTAEARG